MTKTSMKLSRSAIGVIRSITDGCAAFVRCLKTWHRRRSTTQCIDTNK